MFQQRVVILSPEVDVLRICLSAFLLTIWGLDINQTCGKYLPSGNDYFPDLKTTFNNGDVISLTSDIDMENTKMKMLYIDVTSPDLYENFCWYVTASFPLAHLMYQRKAPLASKDCFIYYHQNSIIFTHYDKKTDDALLDILLKKRKEIQRKYCSRWLKCIQNR